MSEEERDELTDDRDQQHAEAIFAWKAMQLSKDQETVVTPEQQAQYVLQLE
jgi:hypothetical protein